MKNVSPALATLINSGVFQYAHIYTITLFGSLGGTSVIRLTDAPIDIAVAGTYPDTNGLVARYTMDAISSGTLIDSVGGNTATLISPGNFSVVSGKLNSGVHNNTNASGRADTTLAWPGNNGTLAFWAKFDSAAPPATSEGLFNCGSLFVRSTTNSPSLQFAIHADGGLPGTASLTADVFGHAALTWSSLAGTTYINGAFDNSGNFGVIPSIANLSMFNDDTGSFFGALDEVLIYNRTLSAAEIARLYSFQGLSTIYSSNTVRVDQRQNKRLAHWKRGLDVDQAVVVFAPRTSDPITGAAFPDTIGSVPFIQAARGGALDGADVQIDRVFFASWPQPYTTPITPVGALTLFAGTPAEVDVNDSQVILTINDYRQLLQNKFPRNVFQLACSHTLYDAGCTLSATPFSVSGIVCSSASTRQALVASANVTPPTSPGSGTFTLGKVTMTSGLNSGFTRTVRQWSAPRSFALLNPLPFTVAAGDTFTAAEGCDKQQATCTAFNNLVNFGGEPFIPDATNAA